MDRTFLILFYCAFVFLLAVLVGAGACFLARLQDPNWPRAIMYAGKAFAGTCALGAAVGAALAA
ncbi:hypothetical protein [Streptomyces sp. NPDC005407]|uniref:hypothetical protein n=1 Tax=Streptomyces sp. NPDC005407 TaxID=3155340 RepID=UPI0033BD1913